MTREIRCEICGGRLIAASGGRFVCEDCGVAYSAERLRELADAFPPEAERAAEPESKAAAGAEPEAEAALDAAADEEPLSEKEQRLRFLEQEQRRLLAEIRMADGVFGPSRRRDLSNQLRKVEKEMARLQGRKFPFFF